MIRRTLFFVLLALYGWAADVSAAGSIVVRGPVAHGASVSWIVNQNFEETGYDNGEASRWTEPSGTVNEDYTSVVLRGSQSMQNTTATAYGMCDLLADYTELWLHFKVQIPTVIPASEEQFFELYDSSQTVFARASLRNTSGLVRSNHGGAISANSASAGDFANATTVRVWVYFRAETADGANNGIIQVWTSTDAETSRASGTQLINYTSGQMHQAVRYLRLPFGLSTNLGVYDQVQVDDVEFTSVDP